MVSIIIPVYNVSKFIDICLNSIIQQTYKDLEIIIVDDGSKDDSLEKCLGWKKKDKRIKVFHNENNGVSYTRNFAIKKSSGIYLTFIDPDDIVAPDFIENLVLNMTSFHADCSVCGIQRFYDEEKIITLQGKLFHYTNKDMKGALFSVFGGFLANKMYKRNIIIKNNLSLNESISISEDLLFNLEYFNYCNNIVYDSTQKYYYRQYYNSSYNNLTNKKWFDIIDTYLLILKNDNLIDLNLKKIVIINFIMILFEAKQRIKKIESYDKDLDQKIKKLYKEYVKKDNIKDAKIKQKIKIILFLLMPRIVMKIKRRNLKG